MKCLFQAALLLVLASFEAGAADLSSFGGLGEAPPQQEKTPFGTPAPTLRSSSVNGAWQESSI